MASLTFSLPNHNKFVFAKLETITRRNHNYTKTEKTILFFTGNILARGFGVLVIETITD